MLFKVHRNGMILTKYAPLLKVISTISKIISALWDAVHKMKELFMLDLILAGIIQLITVVPADKIKNHEPIRSLKPFIL